MIANTPQPPYYAVIFTSVRTEGDEGYSDMSDKMLELASKQDGFLGAESARNELGITVSYWKSMEAVKLWKMNFKHIEAQQIGIKKWYKSYEVRVAKVERDYGFNL
jgi:heme-degrading monooxygenase HmoA